MKLGNDTEPTHMDDVTADLPVTEREGAAQSPLLPHVVVDGFQVFSGREHVRGNACPDLSALVVADPKTRTSSHPQERL